MDKNIEEALKQIEKAYGKGAIMKLNDAPPVDVDVISTGSMLVDKALGVGGFPRGRIVEIYGVESAGKSTLALQTVAQCQKMGDKAAYIDVENAIDPEYAKKLGVDTSDLYFSQPDSGEQALEIVDILAKSKGFSVIVVDSVAALVPQAELDGEMGDANIGLQARLMSKAMRKLTGVANQNKCTIIFINQLREKVGVMFGNPEVTTGGKALKFYSSVRVEMRKSEAIKLGSETIGNKVKVKIVKNKVAAPFKTCEVELIYGEGISQYSEVLEIAVEKKVLEKSGSWYSYNGQKIGQGAENVKQWLKDNPEAMKEIVKKCKEE